jgi:hypothetical protein
VGRLDAIVLLAVGVGLLVLAGGFAVVALTPELAAWAAAHGRCNYGPCTEADIRLAGAIAGTALGLVGLVVTLLGVVRLRRPAAPAVVATAWDLLTAVQAAAASGPGRGRHVIDARGDPALREAVLAALRAHGLQVDGATATGPAPAPRAAATPGSPAPASPGAGTPGPPAPVADRLERLDQLGKLRDAGVLTADEYETLRRKILTGQ